MEDIFYKTKIKSKLDKTMKKQSNKSLVLVNNEWFKAFQWGAGVISVARTVKCQTG